MFDVTALGEILIDFTPCGNAGDKALLFGRNPGGAPTNLLAAVSKYGGKTAFIGKTGQDMFGDFLMDVLRENHICSEGVSSDPVHHTTLAFVSLDRNGDREFSFYRRFGADIFLSKEDIPVNLIRDSRIFHFGSLSLTDEPARSATEFALETAEKNGCCITYDPNYRASLWPDCKTAVEMMRKYLHYADILKVSLEEAQLITGQSDIGEAAGQLLKEGPALVLITDGAEGAYYFSALRSGHVPAYKVNAVDTTGAGDIFFGTFLSMFVKQNKKPSELSSEEIESMLQKAVKAAGLSTMKKGAIPSIPAFDEVFD